MPTGHIKERYNAIPTRREREYHAWLIAEFECSCGCERPATVVHHPLTRHPEQRWRRDHEYVCPMNGDCHMALHRLGHERDEPFDRLAGLAGWYRGEAIKVGKLA